MKSRSHVDAAGIVDRIVATEHHESQVFSGLHGRADKAVERLARRRFEHQDGPPVLARKVQWPHRPPAWGAHSFYRRTSSLHVIRHF